MTGGFRNELANLQRTNRRLWVLVVVLTTLLAGAMIAWQRAVEDIRVIVPPDLANGAILGKKAVHPAAVYQFAFYIWLHLNRWPNDGAVDYPAKIERLAAFLTPRFRAQLKADAQARKRQGELNNRARALHPIGKGYAPEGVATLSTDAWVVRVDVDLRESVHGMEVKHTPIRYPLRVVRFEVDPETNPWGLALDGYGPSGPARIDPPADATRANRPDIEP